MLKVKESSPLQLTQDMKSLELIGKLDEIFSTRINAMKEKYRQWQLNLAFENGLQWHTFDKAKGRIVDLRPSKQRKARVVFNLIGPFVRSTISMLSQSSPTMDVIPASFSSKDERVAKSAQVHLDRIDIVNQKPVNDILLRKFISSFGTGFKLEYWDKTPNMEDISDGVPENIEDLKNLGKPALPIPVYDENTEEKQMEREQRGEVGSIVCSPFEILINYPLVRSGAEIRDFIRYRVLDLDYVMSAWENGKYVNAEDMSNYQVLSELLYSDDDFFSSKTCDNQVVLKEWYEGPSKEHHSGRHIQWANGILLHDGRLSHPKGKLGLFDYHWDINPLDFYGISYIEPLIEPQVIVNRIFSTLTSWLNTSVKFRMAVPSNANFSRSKFTGEGDVFEYHNIGGTGAVNMPIPQIPPGLFEFLQQVINNFKDIASRHEVSKGEIPGDRMSGRAIRSLQEADSQYLIPSMIVWEERERQVALFKLDLMRKYYKKERQARILGEGRNVVLFNLSGADLKEGIDINIVKGSALPKSKVAQQSFIIELYQMGLLGEVDDPQTRASVLKWMDVGSTKSVFGAAEIGTNLQMQEIMAMKHGEPVQVHSFHDHYAHNTECLKELNMPDFNTYPEEYQNMLISHWQEHSTWIARMLSGTLPGIVEEETPTPMPGAGGQIGLPEAVNPQANIA